MDFDALYQQLMQGPDENAKRQAMAQALAAASFGILGARTGGGWRGALGAVGQGGLLGQQVYNNEMANAAQAPMQQLAKALALMDFQGKKQAFDDTNAAREVLKNFQMPSALPSMAPTVGNAAALAAQPKPGNYEKFNAIADALEAKGLIQQANVYRQAAEKYAPQYDGTETVMKDGKPVLLQKFKNQAPIEMGYQPKPDYKQVDTGGQVGFYDPLTGMQGGQFAKTMTPGETDASKRGWSNLGLERDKFAWQQSQDKTTGAVKVGDTVAGIRKEYNALQPTQNYVAAAPLIQSAMHAPDTPAGDLDVIYAVGKALDPNSVVREGELNLVIKSGSPLQRFQGLVNSIGSGRGRLPPEQRQQLLGMLANRVGQLKVAHDQAAAPYIKQAQSLGLPMDQIFQIDQPSVGGALTPAEQQELEALKKRFGRQ